jgi:peptidoglycan/xylan/chitin deacetylase (PgdA/CDA1 family)
MKIPRLLFRILSLSGGGNRLSVLIFHRVLPERDPLFPDEMDKQRFDEMCGWLKDWFDVLPLDRAVAQLKAGALPKGAACITFDDGYADNHHVAMPVLLSHDLTATFFIATGFLDGGRMWNDTIIEAVRAYSLPKLDLTSLGFDCYPVHTTDEKRSAISQLVNQIKYRPPAERVEITEQLAVLAKVRLPNDLMMTSQEVREMHQAGMQIGAHTVSHPILARLTKDQMHTEISESKRFLENLLGKRITLFAYPNGKAGEDYTAESVDIVRDFGFEAAVSTEWGTTTKADDLLQIRRFTPWDKSSLGFGLRMGANMRIR